MRDHGGDLDRAMRDYGAGDWLDLSTGINPVPYPVPDLAPRAFTALPTRADMAALTCAARAAYGATEGTGCTPLAGAQAAIQLIPRLTTPGTARVVTPTYNEHTAALRTQGWQVEEVASLDALKGAALAVVVNPNNPDGRSWSPEALADLATTIGLLIVDESFADPHPGLSLIPHLATLPGNTLVLRSFGKFYGLAGLRLGFAVGAPALIDRIAALAGPWNISGPAIAAGMAALQDTGWHANTCARLMTDATRLDTLAATRGWQLVGGTPLFRTYDTGDAQAAQDRLARHHVWSRIFPYSESWLRLGLPGTEAQWLQLESALRG